MVDTESLIIQASLDQVVRLSTYRGNSRDIGIYHHEWGTATIRDALDTLRFDATGHYALVEAYTSLIMPSSSDRDYCFPSRKTTHISDKTINEGIVHCVLALVHEAAHSMLHHLKVHSPDNEYTCIREEGLCLGNLGKGHWEQLGIGYMYPNIEAFIGLRRMNIEMERNDTEN